MDLKWRLGGKRSELLEALAASWERLAVVERVSDLLIPGSRSVAPWYSADCPVMLYLIEEAAEGRSSGREESQHPRKKGFPLQRMK